MVTSLAGVLKSAAVCLYVIPLIDARQRLSKHFHAAKNVQETIQEPTYASFSVRSASCQRNIDGQFFPELSVVLLITTFNYSIVQLVSH